jgi:hypothetical protein
MAEEDGGAHGRVEWTSVQSRHSEKKIEQRLDPVPMSLVERNVKSPGLERVTLERSEEDAPLVTVLFANRTSREGSALSRWGSLLIV